MLHNLTYSTFFDLKILDDHISRLHRDSYKR